MNRRDFLKSGAAALATAGTAVLLGQTEKLLAAGNSGFPDLVAVKNGDPSAMFDAGIKSLGGIERFVKKGQTVVVKPNIGWDSTPELAADTNPALIGRIIEHCLNAGAKKVYVFDHTCDDWKDCYSNSGIEKAAKNAGAKIASGDDGSAYQAVAIKGAEILKQAAVHELILDSDVFINVPVLKSHGGAKLTMAMKNLMGVVWDRRFWHGNDLDRTISEFPLCRKPDLNILDAYAVMMRNGPRGGSSGDVKIMKMQVLSTDIVATDAAGARIFGLKPEDVLYIPMADRLKIGRMNLDTLNIKRIEI